LLITIADPGESIVVSNTLNRKTIGKDSLGIGLENLRRKVSIAGGKKAGSKDHIDPVRGCSSEDHPD
jgi:hypothetical protein